jgi:hypothetical protein
MIEYQDGKRVGPKNKRARDSGFGMLFHERDHVFKISVTQYYVVIQVENVLRCTGFASTHKVIASTGNTQVCGAGMQFHVWKVFSNLIDNLR